MIHKNPNPFEEEEEEEYPPLELITWSQFVTNNFAYKENEVFLE